MAIIASSLISSSDPAIREEFRMARKTCNQVLKEMISSPLSILKAPFSGLKSLFQIKVKPLVFHASSRSFKKEMDVDRLEKSRADLRSIGGQTVVIRTGNGNLIEGMYIDIDNFKKAMIEQGGQFIVRADGSQSLRCYDYDLARFLCSTLRLQINHDIDAYGPIYSIDLPRVDLGIDREINDKQVTVLTQGNSSIFEMDRTKMGQVLTNGNSCFAFNIRGTGRSHGTPSEANTYEDIEAVYQFLKSKGYSDSKITVNGFCLGSGLAVDLAAKHPVHLVLDRPYAKIGDVMSDIALDMTLEKLKKDKNSRFAKWTRKLFEPFLSHVINWTIISYDNHSKMDRVRGSICYIHSDVDEVIPPSSREKMRKKMKASGATIRTSDQFRHNGFWDHGTQSAHRDHLRSQQILRRFKTTAPKPSIVLERLSKKLERESQEGRKKNAKIVASATMASGPVGTSGAVSGILALRPRRN